MPWKRKCTTGPRVLSCSACCCAWSPVNEASPCRLESRSRNLPWPAPLPLTQLAYLKAPAGRELSLKDIGHKIILIEFLNVYCHTCRGQVPIFNDLYAAIKKDPVLSKSVCMLGIAVGNSLEEVNEFKKTFGAVYPILPDPQKAVFNMTGNIRGTPQSYILSGDRERFIIYYHAGAVSTPEPYLRELQSALRGEITGTAVGNKIPDYSFHLPGKDLQSERFRRQKSAHLLSRPKRATTLRATRARRRTSWK